MSSAAAPQYLGTILNSWTGSYHLGQINYILLLLEEGAPRDESEAPGANAPK